MNHDPSQHWEPVTPPVDRAIGDIIRQTNNLAPEAIEQILSYQREKGVRFGEAAVALGFVRNEDVVWALSQQFSYSYANDSQGRISPELMLATQPFSRHAEAFRAIRSALIMRFFRPEDPKRALAVLSADAGDGKTFFACNLAVALSQLGGRTLLVDANLRRPRVHEVFGLDASSVGLSGVLSGRSAPSVVQPLNELPNLYVLPVGTLPPNPLELVERPAFSLLIHDLLHKFEYVLVDTPSVSLGTDGAVIAAKCGGALVVARSDSTRQRAVDQMARALAVGRTVVAGVVINEF